MIFAAHDGTSDRPFRRTIQFSAIGLTLDVGTGTLIDTPTLNGPSTRHKSTWYQLGEWISGRDLKRECDLPLVQLRAES